MKKIILKIKFKHQYEPWCEDDYDKRCPFKSLDSQGFVIPVGSFDCQKCKYNKYTERYREECFVYCKRKLPSLKDTIKVFKKWLKRTFKNKLS